MSLANTYLRKSLIQDYGEVVRQKLTSVELPLVLLFQNTIILLLHSSTWEPSSPFLSVDSSAVFFLHAVDFTTADCIHHSFNTPRYETSLNFEVMVLRKEQWPLSQIDIPSRSKTCKEFHRPIIFTAKCYLSVAATSTELGSLLYSDYWPLGKSCRVIEYDFLVSCFE